MPHRRLNQQSSPPRAAQPRAAAARLLRRCSGLPASTHFPSGAPFSRRANAARRAQVLRDRRRGRRHTHTTALTRWPPKRRPKGREAAAFFAGKKITVIGANPIQRPLWGRRSAPAPRSSSRRKSPRSRKATHCRRDCRGDVNPATVRANAGAAQLVGWRWLTDAIEHGALQSAEQPRLGRRRRGASGDVPAGAPAGAPESKKASVKLIINEPDEALFQLRRPSETLFLRINGPCYTSRKT